jgi:hypothetical protein
MLPEIFLAGTIVALLCQISALLHRRIDKKSIAL